MSYVFYDTETTGTNEFFDQILQFAAIHTDEEFNVIEEVNLRCRLLPHIIPSFGALMTTGLWFDDLHNQSLSHYQMVSEIQAKISQWSPAVFIGYNSLKFDENLLRQAFYQNLYPIYQTQFNGNARADVLRLVKMAQLFAPDAITIPVRNGKQVFKLDQLTVANGIDHGNAHEALSDVRATIGLMRLIRTNAPQVYDMWWRARDKAYVQDFVASGEPFLTCLVTNSNAKVKPVVPITVGSKGEVWLCNLVEDHERYINLPSDALAKIFPGTFASKFRLNVQPIICKEWEHIEDHEIYIQRADAIRSHPTFEQTFKAALNLVPEPEYENFGVEQKIYEGFWNYADQDRMVQFHQVCANDKINIINGFEDARLKSLAYRWMCIECPEVLGQTHLERFQNELVRRRFEESEQRPYLTKTAAVEDAHSYCETNPHAAEKLDEYVRRIELF